MSRGNVVPILNSLLQRFYGSTVPTGTAWFVDSGAANAGDGGNKGRSIEQPLATLDAAFDTNRVTATNGDVIFILPGHSETISTAVAINVAGVSIIGVGEGDARPQFNCASAIDVFNVSVDDVLIENLVFPVFTVSATTGCIDVAASDCTIRKCQFDLGLLDEECITVTSAGENLTVEDCRFDITVDGPNRAINLEGVVDHVMIRRCVFNGFSAAATWDDSAIFAGAIAVRHVSVLDCQFIHALTAKKFVDLDAAIDPPDFTGSTFTQGGTIAGVVADHSGNPKELWVSSVTGADVLGAGMSRRFPTATIDYAIGLASADNDDKIFVMPKHAETVSGATSWVPDKEGVSVIGLGSGANRPTITMSATTSKIIMSTASNLIENILFLIEEDVVIAIEFTASDCVVKNCEFRNRVAATARQFVNAIDVGGASANDCDRCEIIGCKFTAPAIGSSSCILFSEVCEGVVIADCWCFGDFADACVQSAVIQTNCIVRDCFLKNTNTGEHGLQFTTTATGILVRNYYSSDVTLPGGADTGACESYECFQVNAVDKSGTLAPVIAS